MTTERALGPLGLRLAAAFLTVAVAAVAVFAVLTLLAARSQVSDLVMHQHAADTDATAAAAATAYEATGGWSSANLASAGAVAAQAQATLVVTDADGHVVAAPTDELAQMMARMHGVSAINVARGPAHTASVVVGGHTVGSVRLRFPANGLPGPERQVRDALARIVVAGTALAVAVALLVAVFVARRVVRPVAAVADAAGRLAAGARDVRVGHADAPGELGVLAAAFDQMADSVEREDQLRRNLVADVAHELRTPLTILRGGTEALVDGVTDPTPETLLSLHDEVLRLARLVGDLEMLAAAEAAGLHLEHEPVDLGNVAAHAAELARPTATNAGLTIDLDTRTAIVDGDADRLHQVATNLIANAIRYTPDGGTITIRTGVAGDRSHLEVADTGPGIPDDEFDHLFVRFWRGRAGRTAAGSGIGLAVVAELVTAHGGSVTAANQPDGGARFTVSLPARHLESQGGATERFEP